MESEVCKKWLSLAVIFLSTLAIMWTFIFLGGDKCWANVDEPFDPEDVNEEDTINDIGEEKWIDKDNKLKEIQKEILERILHFQDKISVDSKNPRHHASLAASFLYYARLQIDPKEELSYIKKAIEAYDKALQLGDPYAINSRLNIAYQLYKYNLDIQRAKREYETVLDSKPGYEKAVNGLIRIYVRTYQYEKALELVNDNDLNKPYDKSKWWAIIYLTAIGNPMTSTAERRKYLNLYLNLDRTSDLKRYRAYKLAFRAEKDKKIKAEYWKEACFFYHRSESDYKTARARDPGSIEVVKDLGHFYSESGQHLKAMELYKAYLENDHLSFGLEDRDRLICRMRLGAEYECLGMIEEAIKQYEQVVEIRGSMLNRPAYDSYHYIRIQRLKNGLKRRCAKPLTFTEDCKMQNSK